MKYLALAFIVAALLLAGLLHLIIAAFGQDLPSPQGHADIEQSVSTRILDMDGEVIDEFFVEDRIPLSFPQIPTAFIDAITAIEDRRFYHHWGLDPIRVIRAAQKDIVQMQVREGASTITQQLARNLFLHHRRTWKRKIQEAVLALRIERAFSKEEILELYANQIYFGEGAYGLEAAARRFCGVGAGELTVDQCAMLAGMVANPAAFAPRRHPESCLRRRNLVLGAMTKTGALEPVERDSLIDRPLALGHPERAGEHAAYFTETVRRDLMESQGSSGLYHQGLSVRTTLDLELQKAAEQIVEEHLRSMEKANDYPYLRGHADSMLTTQGLQESRRTGAPLRLQAAVVALEPATGAIRAMVGGRDFGESQYNRALQAPRQPASAFKPFIYAEAIRRGYRTNDLLLDAPVEFEIPGAIEEESVWKPENFEKTYHGPVTLRYALMKSINVPTARLLNEIGPQAVIDLAGRLGVQSQLPEVLSLATGTGEMRLIEMTSAYAVFANNGIRVEPYLIERVYDQHGHLLEMHEPRSEQVLDERTSYIVTHMLCSAVDTGTGQLSRSLWRFKAPAAGKTGTNDDYTDAWFVGYTPHLVVGVWVGFDLMIPIGDKRTGTGAMAALPIWAQLMRAAAPRYGSEEFPMPEGLVKVRTCIDSGQLATPQCPEPIEDVFLPGTEPTQPCRFHQGETMPEGDFEELDRYLLHRDRWQGTSTVDRR